MRLATFFGGSGQSTAAFLLDGTLVPVASAAAASRGMDGENYPCARSALALGRTALLRAHERAQLLLERGEVEPVALADVKLAPPVVTPEKIICVGLNYYDHAAEAGLDTPPQPALFAKFANALTGHGAPVALPAASAQVDYEGELAFVIGETCRHVPEERALEVVAGLTVFNDISARDLQMQTSQWLAGKGLDAFAPCGPAIVSLDEVADPQALRLTTTVNGEVVQQASTSQMIFGIARLVSFVSSLMTLRPGDTIATGTPAGVGFARQPPRFLADGDTVEIEIERVGRLANSFVSSPPSSFVPEAGTARAT